MTTLHDAARMAIDAISDLKGYRDDIDEAIAALREALEAPEPELDNDDVLWLWKNGNHFLAFRHLYPCYSPGGDPMTLGEPFGKAFFRHSFDRVDAPPAAPADDHATPSGGQEAGPQEDRIEAAYWRFDARHKGYSQWKSAPMSERDAFKAEMRNALEAEKVRAEMRLVARGWRRPARVPLTDEQLAKIAVEDEFLLYCDQESFNEIARAIEAAHGIGGSNG